MAFDLPGSTQHAAWSGGPLGEPKALGLPEAQKSPFARQLGVHQPHMTAAWVEHGIGLP